MKIILGEGDAGTFLVTAESGRDVLVQADWDFPGLASMFGWCPCPCGATDGTIDCDHKTVSEMIVSARDYLTAHVGDTADDPGYF
jgi:hypothetical protein